VEELTTEQLQTLVSAIEKAEKLVSYLEKQQAEVEKSPPKDIPPQQLEQGRQAMQNAINSAKRMCESLKSALAVAGPTN